MPITSFQILTCSQFIITESLIWRYLTSAVQTAFLLITTNHYTEATLILKVFRLSLNHGDDCLPSAVPTWFLTVTHCERIQGGFILTSH
jgi:hypothetical protein